MLTCASLLVLLPTVIAVSETCGIQTDCKEHQEAAATEYMEEVSDSWRSYLKSYDAAKIAPPGEDKDWHRTVIDKDLEPFTAEGVSQHLLDECRKVDSHAVTYQAVGGHLYRSPDCLFPARCQGVEHFLLKAVNSKTVPDFELVLNTHDWPQINKHFHANKPLPTFSFSKTNHHFDIFFPAWTFWGGGPAISHHPAGLGRWDLMRQTVASSAERFPWHSKKDVAFFRGSRTSRDRDPLVRLSRNRPELIDAKYTKNQAWKSADDTLGESPAQEVRLEDHCQFRYLFNFRGVAASFRYKHLFLCGSTVIHVGPEWKEFFYDSLTPWYHYVPVNEDQNTEEGLDDLVRFLCHFTQISRTIAVNGQEWIRQRLTMGDVERYWEHLLRSYSKLLTFQPNRKSEFIRIK